MAQANSKSWKKILAFLRKKLKKPYFIGFFKPLFYCCNQAQILKYFVSKKLLLNIHIKNPKTNYFK